MESGVYILSLSADANPENRWILPFNQAIMKAFDALEWHLEHEAGDLPAALLTVSESPKFFSNGIDPTGAYGKQIGLEPPSEVDQLEGIILGMPGFIRPLQLPIPTIAAVSNAAPSLCSSRIFNTPRCTDQRPRLRCRHDVRRRPRLPPAARGPRLHVCHRSRDRRRYSPARDGGKPQRCVLATAVCGSD